jgi:hypothetical protein
MQFEERARSTQQPQPAFGYHDPGPTEALRHARSVMLALEHRDLDDAIATLSAASTCDDALLTRLKKRKLQIKDELARLEGGDGAG